MENKQKQEKEQAPQAPNASKWDILREIAVPASVFIFFVGALFAGVFFSIPDILPFAAILAFPLMLATMNFNGLTCFALSASILSLALALSSLPLWRTLVLFLTFALPSLVLMFYRSYPARMGKMITLFFEESSNLDSTSGVCALAVRTLKSKGFFRHIALLLWNKEQDTFRIAAGTSAYEIGTEIPSDSTFYLKCHSSLKPDCFRAPHSSANFLPSKFKARSALCAPLHLGGRRFGVLVAESHSTKPWSRVSQQVLYLFALVLSFAIAEFERRESMKRVSSIIKKKGSFPAGKNT